MNADSRESCRKLYKKLNILPFFCNTVTVVDCGKKTYIFLQLTLKYIR
jgi:hypothetical protein